ncbi:MAG: OmpA family protein [Gammaproteobacteria bacterium]|nr:OmpA family protein [Gammaproteobacteria bacterium]
MRALRDIIGVLWLTAGVAAAQSNATVLEELQALRAEAENRDAALLAPDSYLRGVRALEKAAAQLEAGQDPQKLAPRFEKARQEFTTAIEHLELAQLSFRDTLLARTAANAAEAFRLAPADWENAERSLFNAARVLEDGNLNEAIERGAMAAAEYDRAELVAIKARYLTTSRSLMAQAGEAKADKFAPRSIGLARDALQLAENTLDADRTQTARARELAATAAYEARHALHIAGIAARVKDRELSVEDIVLDWEEPLRRLAETADRPADLSRGYAEVEASLREELQKVPTLEAELEERRIQVAGLEEEIRELDDRLGGATAERSALMRELQARDRLREQFTSVEELFAADEAIVLRDGNQLILRMVGLQFGSGSARLDDAAMALLDRLRDAVNIFPGSSLRVEGHTDASGDPERNLQLSEERARAVANYLAENLGIQSFRLSAVGYGDTRPIAGNRTREGRARNRRIDIVLDTRTGA